MQRKVNLAMQRIQHCRYCLWGFTYSQKFAVCFARERKWKGEGTARGGLAKWEGEDGVAMVVEAVVVLGFA